MSFRVHCPNGHELAVEPSHIGRKIRCPACKAVMIVSDPNAGKVAARPPAPRQAAPPAPRQAPPPAPRQAIQQTPPRRRPVEEAVDELEEVAEVVEEPAYDEERPRKTGMKTGPRMRLANIGLAFHYAKILCIIVAMLINLFTALIAPFVGIAASAGSVEGAGAGLGLMGILGCLALLLFGATPLLGGTGSLLCFWVPAKSGSRVLVIVSFGLEVGGVAMLVLGYVLAFASAAEGAIAAAGSMGVVSLLGVLASLAGFILFMLFLRALAYYLRDGMSAEEALRHLILFLATGFGGAVLLFVLALVLARAGRFGLIVLGICGLGWFVTMLLVFIGILKLIGTVRARINSRWG